MSDYKKKTIKSDFKAIKLGITLSLALLLGLFSFVGNSYASFDFEDTFDFYNIDDLTGQGYWLGIDACYSFEVSTTTYKFGFQGVTHDGSGFCNGNLKDGTGLITSDLGVFTFWFKITTDTPPPKALHFYLTNNNNMVSPARYQNAGLWLEITNWNGINLYGDGTATTSVKVANTTPINVWNKIEIEYDYVVKKGRALLHGSDWSDLITLQDIGYINSYWFQGGGEGVSFDNISWGTGIPFDPECDFGVSCIFCGTETSCSEHNCFWYDNLCWRYKLSPLPVVEFEDCSVLGTTDRILCEIKNFFQGLFVPTPEKISELKTTIDLIKGRFPYNYILEFKNFFSYLKDNINDSQAINFSILGQQASLNFAFWHTTTTIAGSEQTIKDIIQKVFGFLIILGFGFWAFGFIKRIFR